MKFRVEEDCVVCYLTPDSKYFEQSKLYRVDLTNRVMYLDGNQIQWDLPEDIENEIVLKGIKEANLYIESGHSLLFRYKNQNDEKNIAKQEKIIQDNTKIREYLKNYSENYYFSGN